MTEGMRLARATAIVVVFVCLKDGSARADDEWFPRPDHASVRTHAARVQIAAAKSVGLEVGLPRDGSYARAIAADAEGDFGEAVHAYDDALGELAGLAGLTSASGDQLAAWRAKIRWQRERSEDILEEQAYVSVMPTSVLARVRLARALHEKFITTRAFLGRGPRLLWNLSVGSYHDALALDSRCVAARLGLAALDAEVGHLGDARAEFAKIGRRRDDQLNALFVATYYTMLDDKDDAFTYLARAAIDNDTRSWIEASNDYDSLRDDPRFARIVGGDKDPHASTACSVGATVQ
jgi:hypothetical protein